MDISNFDSDQIEFFDLCYTAAAETFGEEPITASPERQRAIRKRVSKTYIGSETYPPEITAFIGKNASDRDFIAFLHACHRHVQQANAEKRRKFEVMTAKLSDDVKDALWRLVEERQSDCTVRKVGNALHFDVGSGETYDYSLILEDVSGLPEELPDKLYFYNCTLTEQSGVFCLRGDAEDDTYDHTYFLTLRFSTARVEICAYRGDVLRFGGTPWDHLLSMAQELVERYSLPGSHLNSQEQAVLPLAGELCQLSVFVQVPPELHSQGMPLLRAEIRNLGCTELLPLLDKAVQNVHGAAKLERKLNQQKYEPLWRRLYDQLAATQTDRPTKAAVLTNGGELSALRSQIQQLLHTHGYEGQYPDFRKNGALNRIRTVNSYQLDYFVGFEKNVVYRIHCTETWFNGHLMVEFLCGTAFLKKSENPGDIYSCTFDAKGRRLFQTVTYEKDYVNQNDELESDDLPQRVAIAVKRAELIPLTKEERIAINGFDPGGPFWIPVAILVMGIPFGLFMTLGFMLITVIACLCVGQPEAIPSMFTELPWLALFLFSFLLFGGAMSIVTLLASRK